MERIMKALAGFDEELKKKGYDNAFLTANAFPDKLQKSIGKYLYDSLLGKEAGLSSVFSLSTYLEWNGEEKNSVSAYMRARFRFGEFDIGEMDINYLSPYGGLIRRIELKNISLATLPDRRAAIELVKHPPMRQVHIEKQKKNKLI